MNAPADLKESKTKRKCPNERDIFQLDPALFLSQTATHRREMVLKKRAHRQHSPYKGVKRYVVPLGLPEDEDELRTVSDGKRHCRETLSD